MAIDATPAAQEQSRYALVGVVDETGAPMMGLGSGDFIVENDHRRCDVIGVTPAAYPIAVVVDTSAFATSEFQLMRQAVERFVDRASGERDVAVYASGSPVTKVVDFTRDHDALARGVTRLFASRTATTHTLETIREAAEDLRARHAPVTGIVVTSAGGIETTAPRTADVLPVVLASHAIVHIVDRRSLRLNQGTNHQSQLRSPQSGGGDVLESLALRTSGKYIRGAAGAVYSSGLDTVGRELDSEVIMEYAVAKSARYDLHVGLIVVGSLGRAIGLDNAR
jgi:hypothetical protein